jgi:hypothetical protein
VLFVLCCVSTSCVGGFADMGMDNFELELAQLEAAEVDSQLLSQQVC